MLISRRGLIRKSLVACAAGAAYSAMPNGLAGQIARPSGEPFRETAILPLHGGSGRLFDKVVMLGDSNPSGTGQENGFFGGVMGRLSRSIINSFGGGSDDNQGYAFESLMSPHQLLLDSKPDWFGYASAWEAGKGATGTLAILGDGNYMELSGRKLSTIKFAYHPVLSEGSRWEVSVDGEVIKSGVADSSGSTGEIRIPKILGIFSVEKSVRFSCVKGKLYFQHAETIESDRSDSPFIWCAPEGSQGFSQFFTEERVSSIAPHVNARPGNTLVCVMLGTNNFLPMSFFHQPPEKYIGLANDLVARWSEAIDGEPVFALAIPPKPRVELPFAPYEEYAKRTVELAFDRPEISVIRTDESPLGGDDTEGLYSSDGIHLNGHGHRVWAEAACRHFGIAYNDYSPFKVG